MSSLSPLVPLLLCLILSWIFNLLYSTNVFRPLMIFNDSPTDCHVITSGCGIGECHGIEDIEYYFSPSPSFPHPFLLLSTDQRRHYFTNISHSLQSNIASPHNEKYHFASSLRLFSPYDQKFTKCEITNFFNEKRKDFHPHGIFYFQNSGGGQGKGKGHSAYSFHSNSHSSSSHPSPSPSNVPDGVPSLPNSLLFVVNHDRIGHHVDVFSATLKVEMETNRNDSSPSPSLTPSCHFDFVSRISSPLFTSINDVVAYSDNVIFVTKDYHYELGTLPHELEIYTQRGYGEIIKCEKSNGDGNIDWQCASVVKNLFYPNGISFSPNGKFLYVAEVLTKQISIFTLGKQSNLQLKQIGIIPTPYFAPDNITPFVDEKGTVSNDKFLVSGHPSLLSFPRHVKNPNSLSPSMAILIQWEQNHFQRENQNSHDDEENLHLLRHRHRVLPFTSYNLHTSDGHLLSASSVVVQSKGNIYVGAVFDEGMLQCPLRVEEIIEQFPRKL